MNQIPLTNMEDRWVLSTKEAFDALVGMGYKLYFDFTTYSQAIAIEVTDVGDGVMTYAITNLYDVEINSKQAYFHKGHFYDQPYEEFTITEEKVPFPELKYDDNYTPIIKISSAMFEIDKGDFDSLYEWALNLENERSWLYIQHVDQAKKEIFLKSIDRRLHKNRPLALAIGKILDELDSGIKLSKYTFLNRISTTGKYFTIEDLSCEGLIEQEECTLPDDYIFPDQVIEWMHEYEKEEKNA